MNRADAADTSQPTGELQQRVDGQAGDPWEELRSEVVGGLLYAHSRANANTAKALEVASFCYALIELLNEKGILSIDELDQRKEAVSQRLVEKFREAGMGVMRQEPEQDKYTYGNPVQIDCHNRVHLCKAACCRLAFALSKQDVEEGTVKWDFAHPYMNARRADGYCVHHECQTSGCTVYSNRPVPCRAYDCRNDKRIWVDFEKKLVNPDLEAVFATGQRA
jgi:Fe-S-cluster containining protein